MCFHGFPFFICSLKLESFSLTATANVIVSKSSSLKSFEGPLFLWVCILGPANSLQWLSFRYEIHTCISFISRWLDSLASPTRKSCMKMRQPQKRRNTWDDDGTKWRSGDQKMDHLEFFFLSHAQSWTFLEQVVFRSRWLVYLDYHIGIS